jgi:selenocysteine lyase/cysteine desulfurase
MNIPSIRQQFPPLKQYIWFQNGGVSLTPTPIADEHARLMKEIADRGPMHIVYPDEEYPRRQQSLERIACFFSAHPDELAIMRGVSEAFHIILSGFQWQAGDQIIITDDEEAALLLPVLHLQNEIGVKVIKLPLIDDDEKQIDALRERLSKRTRLMALSHVNTDLGYRLPVHKLCAVARENCVFSFLDLAHSAGLFPISLHDIDCDAAGILSYKWMYAPYAAGALYVKRDRVVDLNVQFAGGRSEQWLDFEKDQYKLQDTTARFQYGPWSWPLIHTWAFAADWLMHTGLENIWNRTTKLTNRLKQGLLTIPGTVLYTPESHEFSAALVTFGLTGWTGEKLSKALLDRWRIVIKPLPHSREGLRASITFFHLEEEIDLLLDSLRTLAKETS